MNKKNILLIFGYGYTAKFICKKFLGKNWKVFCTTRVREKTNEIKSNNASPVLFSDAEKIERIFSEDLYVLSTVPPESGEDPVIKHYGTVFKKNRDRIKWMGYLSTTSVYGDKKGAWVTEDTVLEPYLERSIIRANIEKYWINLGATNLIKTMVFRLAGIYGPGRNLIDRLRTSDKVYIVDKPNHFFNRIHVEDIVGAIEVAMSSKTSAIIFNLSDDLPATQLDVAQFAASLLKIKCPETVSIKSEMVSEMARSFYKEEKKVSNKKLKDELRYKLTFPSFKDGLSSIYKSSKEF
jgi:nucleoside-diphosphate-sugar epimerase